MAIIVPIGVDTKGLQRGLTGARGQLARFGKIAALAAGAAALGGLVKTLQIGTEEFMEQQRVAAQTEAVLKSTGGVAKVTAGEIATLAESLMKKSGVDDEAIQSGQNMLLTFTRIRNEVGEGNNIFDQATQATLDLSVAMGKDMQSSAILVGKALNDPVKGATALSRAGIQLTESQKEQIKTFVESGRVMDAQKIILRELETQFGGSAEAAGKTLPGQLNILKQTFSNLAGELAGKFLPGLATAATALVEFLSEFSEQPTLTAKVRFVVSKIGEVAWTGVQALKTWWFREAGTTELPARIVLIAPGGKQQLEQILASLKPTSERLGREAGKAYADALLGASRDDLSSTFNPTIVKILRFAFDPINQTGQFLGRNLVGPFIKGFTIEGTVRIAKSIARSVFNAAAGAIEAAASVARRVARTIASTVREFLFETLPGAVSDAVSNAWESVKGRISGIKDQVADAFTPSGRSAKRLKDKITDTVLQAVQSARRTLQSLGGEILGFLTEIRAASMRSPGGLLPKDILAEQRRLEDARLQIEEERLRAALAEAEDKTQAQLDLDEFLLNKEITLRDRALADQQATDQAAVDSLVDRFNRGLISADQFYSELQAIIGPAQGDALGAGLGDAFVNRFKLAVEEIKAVVADIFAVVGQGEPIGAGGGGAGVGAALKSENQRRFDDAMRVWEQQRDRIQKRIDNARKNAKKKDSPGKETITKEEKDGIDDIIAELNKHRKKKPQRAAYGLALGGILKKTVFAAGEAGPEAVIPLQSQGAWNMLRDAAMASGGNGRGGGDIYLTVNAGLGTNPDELSRVIVESIKRYERRNGVVFSGPLVTATGNAQGQVSTASGAGDFNFVRLGRRG